MMRRAVRARPLLLIGLAAVVVAVLAIVLLADRPRPAARAGDTLSPAALATARAAASHPSCGWRRSNVTVRDVPDVLYLPSAQIAGPVAGRVDPEILGPGCTTWADRRYVAYVMSHGEVIRRLLVTGPEEDSSEPYNPNDNEQLGVPKESTLTIGGLPRDLYDRSGYRGAANRWVYASWRESDGGSWAAITQGATPAVMRKALQALTITNGMVRNTTAPPGFSTWAPPVDRSSRNGPVHSLGAQFHVVSGVPAWQWYVAAADVRDEAPLHARRVRIGAVSGWWQPPGAAAPDSGGALEWSQDGLVFQLRSIAAADLTLEQAISVARSVTKVSPDDLRLWTTVQKK